MCVTAWRTTETFWVPSRADRSTRVRPSRLSEVAAVAVGPGAPTYSEASGNDVSGWWLGYSG